MAVENIDLLLVTETHHAGAEPPGAFKTTMLRHTGVSSSKAGLAVLARKSGGWSSPDVRVLVPGYAMILRVDNLRSVDSLWVLCVYGDVSSVAALTAFYSELLTALLSFVVEFESAPDPASLGPRQWAGCLALGDWNMVAHLEDRSPPKAAPPAVLSAYSDVIVLCMAGDSAGPDPYPRGFTWSMAHGQTRLWSRLDRIYVPIRTWTAHLPVAVPTNWSDHKLVYADCTLRNPRVQLAVPAKRLPSSPLLDSSSEFWVEVMADWTALCDGPITLPRWCTFKKRVLESSTKLASQRRSSRTKNWRSALRGDLVPEEDLAQAVWEALAPPTCPRQSTRPPLQSRWRSTLPDRLMPWQIAQKNGP